MTQVEALATSISNLVVTPSTGGVSVSFNTNNAVRAQLQIGTASGTYGSKFTIESAVGVVHLLSGYGLSPNTTYHYILQFYDAFMNTLDATTDATFTTAAAPTSGAPAGAIIGPLLYGTGVPAATLGSDGMYYFRQDGTAGASIYHKVAGAWVATAA